MAAAARELGAPAILVNNASALWWKPIEAAPLSRFDLIHGINARGTFACTRARALASNPHVDDDGGDPRWC